VGLGKSIPGLASQRETRMDKKQTDWSELGFCRGVCLNLIEILVCLLHYYEVDYASSTPLPEGVLAARDGLREIDGRERRLRS